MTQARTDASFFWLPLILSVSGLVYIYSATWDTSAGGIDFSLSVLKQAAYLALSLIAFFVVQRVNWGLRPGSWVWFYIPVVFFLLAVIFIGTDHGTGAKRWIDIAGPASIQPSELAKLGFILILAWIYSEPDTRPPVKFGVALFAMLSLMLMVMGQPDLGTSMVFFFAFFVMSLLSQIPRRWLALVFIGFALVGVFGYFFVLRDYQRARITSFINPDADPRGSGYQVRQSRVALGSGGMFGKGFLKGTQSKGNFIPVIESDFIFALIGEEFGFFGCLYVLILFFFLIFRILALSRDAPTEYERFICYGASAVIFFHVFVASGMTMGLTPITGLPLPFISQGGTSLLTMWTLMGICASISRNSKRSVRGR